MGKTTAHRTSSMTHSTPWLSAKGSSVLRCAFLPFRFRYSLFASVIHEIDSQHVQVHDTRSRRVLCDHSTNPTASITCLDWGWHQPKYHDELQEPLRKKRKIYSNVEDQDSRDDRVVVAYGTSDSKIHLLAPCEGKVVATLEGGHTLGIKDFKFSSADDHHSGWSLGGDGNLVQWNLQKVVKIRTITFADTSANTLLPTRTHILYASHTVHRIDLGNSEKTVEFRASITNVHNMVLSTPGASGESSKLLTTTHANSQMLIFDLYSADILLSLVAQSDIVSLSYLPAIHADDDHDYKRQVDLLAVITAENKVEIFSNPFDTSNLMHYQHQDVAALGNKPRIKRSSAIIQLQRRNETRSSVPILSGCFSGHSLLIAWLEDGLNVCFEEILCLDPKTGDFLLSGSILKPTSEPGILAGGKLVSSEYLRSKSRSNIDESHAIVLHGGHTEHQQQPVYRTEVIDISSAVEETDSSDDEGNDLPSTRHVKNNQIVAKDTAEEDIRRANDDVDKEEAPSFGELIAVATAKSIEVTAVPASNEAQALVPLSDRNVEPTTHLTFATLLPQALGTNDNVLLERCLHVADTNMIRATVERLNPTLATALLQKLADRLHSRPGRAGNLLVWIQWTLIAHGGYLGTQTASTKKLGVLYRVVRERANSLRPLLSLKGKLDMLEAQMNMRRSIQHRLGNRMIEDQISERAAEYVEGQDEASSDENITNEERHSDTEAVAITGSISTNSITGSPDLYQTSHDSGSDDQRSDDKSSVVDPAHLFDLEASESDQSISASFDEDIDFDGVDAIHGDEENGTEEPSGKGKVKLELVNGIGAQKS